MISCKHAKFLAEDSMRELRISTNFLKVLKPFNRSMETSDKLKSRWQPPRSRREPAKTNREIKLNKVQKWNHPIDLPIIAQSKCNSKFIFFGVRAALNRNLNSNFSIMTVTLRASDCSRVQIHSENFLKLFYASIVLYSVSYARSIEV